MDGSALDGMPIMYRIGRILDLVTKLILIIRNLRNIKLEESLKRIQAKQTMLPANQRQLFSMIPAMQSFQQPQLIHSQMNVVKSESMDTRVTADLYLCDSGNCKYLHVFTFLPISGLSSDSF